MAAWHRSWKADFGLRLLGLCCWGIAYAALSRLFALRGLLAVPGALAYACAATGFLAASAGAALTLFGHHLFDQIEVSARWRRGSTRDVAVAAAFLQAQASLRRSPPLGSEPSMLSAGARQ